MPRPLLRRTWIALLLTCAATAGAGSEVVNIRQKVRAGEKLALSFDPTRTTRVELLLRRINPKQTETQIALGFTGASKMEGLGALQVDRDDLHHLAWAFPSAAEGSGRLVLSALNGDVYIETATADTTAPARPPHHDPARQTLDLQRKLRSGEGVDTGLPARNALRVEARVRRLNPAQRETRLDLNPGGGVAQVDRQDLHLVTWTPESPGDAQGNLRIHARDGDVYIESVAVTYRVAR